MAVRPAERRLGMMTPWAPAHSAVRRMAPRLWGSEISSHTTSSAGSPFAAAAESSDCTDTYSRIAARAMTPWWAWVRLMPSSLRRSASTTTMPFSRAREAMWPRVLSVSPLARYILSIFSPERSASITALRPSMIPSASAWSRGRCLLFSLIVRPHVDRICKWYT